MSRNVEQHHAFEGGFEALRTYAADVKAGKVTYDGKEVTALIDSFGPVLNEHLHDEVKMILELEPYDGALVKKILDNAAQEGLKTADPVKSFVQTSKVNALIHYRFSSFLSSSVSRIRPPLEERTGHHSHSSCRI